MTDWITTRTLSMSVGGELHAMIEDTHLTVWVENDRDFELPTKIYLHGDLYRTAQEATLVANLFFDVIGGDHKGETA
jgi:hypothetical protein